MARPVRPTGRKRHRTTQSKMAPLPNFLPGLRGGADWSVTELEAGGMTLNQFGQVAHMAIPPMTTPDNRFTVLHEMLHAAHSPMEAPKTIVNPLGNGIISADGIMMAEEYRINTFSRYLLGFEEMPPLEEGHVAYMTRAFTEYNQNINPYTAAQILKGLFVFFPFLPQWPSVGGAANDLLKIINKLESAEGYNVHLISAVVFEAMNNVIEYSTYRQIEDTEHPWSWKKNLQLALLFDMMCENPYSLVQSTSQMKQVPQPGHGKSGSGKQPTAEERHEQSQADVDDIMDDLTNGSDAFKSVMRKASQQMARREDEIEHKNSEQLGSVGMGLSAMNLAQKARKGERKELQEFDPSDLKNAHDFSDIEWGKMNIKRLTPTIRVPRNKLIRSKSKPSEEGAVPRYPHRAFSDGKIFGRKRKERGGSVLIDDSGSMNWEEEEIKQIMEAAPATSIAAYSAAGWKEGWLYIYAEGEGKYASPEGNDPHTGERHRPPGGNNLVDFPALEWLAQQPKPRIWVTDGYTIPKSYGEYTEHASLGFIQCIEYCYENDINIVRFAAEAGAVFRGERSVRL